MTIKVEREALLRVLERPPQQRQQQQQQHHPQHLLVDYGNLISSSSPSNGEKVLRVDHDDDSVFTLSTASSFSDTDSEDGQEEEEERRVSFAPTLVTDEWTRPFTAPEDLGRLFYTTEETQRFRQDYRRERKLLSELGAAASHPESLAVGDLKKKKKNTGQLSCLVDSSCSPPRCRHSISRVVVLHGNKLETFMSPPSKQPLKHHDYQANHDKEDAFFDNDSFWSGSITWY